MGNAQDIPHGLTDAEALDMLEDWEDDYYPCGWAHDKIKSLTTEVREANHEKHMAVVKKLSEISLLKGGWLDAIKAIDWFEEQTAEPCEPYPQSERDHDRKWLEDTAVSSRRAET